jgi:hypothetical protein
MTDKEPLRSVTDSLARLQKVSGSKKVQRGSLAIASVILGVGTVLSYLKLPLDRGDFIWGYFAVSALIGAPLTFLANAFEFHVIGRMAGTRHRMIENLRVSAIAAAANLLPLPGAALVRIQAVAGKGVGYRKALTATALIGLAWLGVTFLVSGSFLVPARPGFSWVLFAAGVVSMTLFFWATLNTTGSVRLALGAMLVEVGLVATIVLRYYFVLAGLGLEPSVGSAAVLTLGPALSSAVGFLPGGLGLRELVAGAAASLVGLPPAAGFLTAAVDRVLGLGMTAVFAALLLSLGGIRESPLSSSVESADAHGERQR